MKATEILIQINQLRSLLPITSQFKFFHIEVSNHKLYYGIDNDGSPVFAIESSNPKCSPLAQQTRSLVLGYNILCTFDIDGIVENKTMHIITCKSSNVQDATAFISLTNAFVEVANDDSKNIVSLFTSLSNLFSLEQESNISNIELQGFYAELYLIRHLHKQGVEIYPYWQKKDRLKFDFSISEKKRIEVKSTLQEERIHHFKHEQLISGICNIYIASFLLREDDAGLSLFDLIEDVRGITNKNFDTLLYIARFIKGIPIEALKRVKFSEEYSNKHIQFFDVAEVPKYNCEQPQGVSRTEYDSNLSTAATTDISNIITWIKEA